MTEHSASLPWTSRRLMAVAVFVIATIVYWRTAYPTITWWDGSSYPLAAYTLGVTSGPGSLLLTLLGWPVAHLPVGSSPAYLLNLFAGLLAATAATLVYVASLRLMRTREAGAPSVVGGATTGTLTFAFSDTLWDHATKFTPYVLTAVFTGLILWTMIRWWDEADHPDAWRRLALLGLLFGLDFSVHRTNALLLPGALVWILIRDPGALRRGRVWVAGLGALLAGLALQLLVIPMATFANSPLDFNTPTNLSLLWDYVTLKQLGGGFLLDVVVRKSNLWSVQTADFLRVLGANFFHWSGPAGVIGTLPAIAALIGVGALWRRERRLAIAFIAMLLLQAIGTVLYFNIPADYFRSFDRHYLPVCVTIAVLVTCGMGAIAERFATLARTRNPLAAAFVLAGLILPAGQLLNNWTARDASHRYFVRDYAVNALSNLPPNAVYVTVGDNDTFPALYLQAVEGVRPDVAILNLSVANIAGYEQRRRARDPSFPVSLSTAERHSLLSHPWTDTTITVPLSGTAASLGVSPVTLPAAITFTVRSANEGPMYPADLTIFDIVRTNQWRRPLTFAITAGSSALAWLELYARLDGLYYRIVPMRASPLDIPLVRSRLMERTSYRGYADESVLIDDVARTMAFQYVDAARALLDAEHRAGLGNQCRADAAWFAAKMPPTRLRFDDAALPLASACGPK